jgi:hypothetical protein
MTIDDVKIRYNRGDYTASYPSDEDCVHYCEGYVFDDEKSVKWNRNERERLNKHADDAMTAYRARVADLSEKLSADIAAALVSEYNFTNKFARKLYNYVHDEHHSYMGDVFIYVSEVADLCSEVEFNHPSNTQM